MTEATKSQAKVRPISPHLDIWRWHVTMATSILHRVTGVGNTLGLIILLAWIYCLSSGSEAYAVFASVAGSFIGRFVIFCCLLSMAYHIVNGVRHLFFNLGIGLTKTVASKTAWGAILGGAVFGVIMYALGLYALAQ